MTKITRRTVLLGLASLGGVGVAGLLACADDEPDLRPELVAAVAELLRAEVDAARARAGELHDAALALCEGPDAERLAAVREAWSQLRAPWKRLLVLPVGPIVDDGYDAAIDFWPARPTSIEGAIEAGVASLAELEPFGVASKGMPALEYLLWDPVGGDEAILARLTAADTGPARCTFAAVVAEDLDQRVEMLATATTAFADELADAGSSARYPSLALAVDELLNAAIAGLHAVAELSLSKPLGLSTGTPLLDQLESRFSDRSGQDVRDALDGFANFYLGVDPAPGFWTLVDQASPEIDGRVRDQLELARTEAAGMPEPLREILDTDPDAATRTWAAIRDLRQLLAADVASLLGVTVSLTDNDGD